MNKEVKMIILKSEEGAAILGPHRIYVGDDGYGRRRVICDHSWVTEPYPDPVLREVTDYIVNALIYNEEKFEGVEQHGENVCVDVGSIVRRFYERYKEEKTAIARKQQQIGKEEMEQKISRIVSDLTKQVDAEIEKWSKYAKAEGIELLPILVNKEPTVGMKCGNLVFAWLCPCAARIFNPLFQNGTIYVVQFKDKTYDSPRCLKAMSANQIESAIAKVRSNAEWIIDKLEGENHICAECGKPFASPFRNKKYCSRACKNAAKINRTFVRKSGHPIEVGNSI